MIFIFIPRPRHHDPLTPTLAKKQLEKNPLLPEGAGRSGKEKRYLVVTKSGNTMTKIVRKI